MSLRRSFPLAAFASLIAVPAVAGTLVAPFAFVGAGATPFCIITNVDSKEIEVTVSATNFFGTTRTANSNNCPVPPNTLGPNETCYADYAAGSDLTCKFTAKGKVRASTQLLDGSDNLLIAIPATAK